MQIPKDYFIKKDGKWIRREDIEKEEPTHLPPQKRPIEQNENIPPSEPLTDKEVEEIRNDILQHPAFNLCEDSIRHKIIFGDIAYPKEYDKFIDQESNISEMVVISQVAILAKESAYLALHLLRWIYEEIKEGDVIAGWYKKAPLPFTHRTKAPTYTSYKTIEQILYMRGELSHLRNDFKTGYERLLEVAGKCDIERPKWFRVLPVKPINDFKSAAVKFLEIVKIINSEANIALGKLTQENTGQDKGEIIIEGEFYKQIQSDENHVLSAEAKAAILIIADETDKLADYIKNVGPSQSARDKINRLRKRIVEDSERYGWAYVPREDRNPIATMLHDLLITIVNQILPYYQGMRKTPKPKENAEKLKNVAGQLRRLAGEQSAAKTGLSGGDAQGFKFDGDKQAMYNGRDLDISSGRAVKILKLLYDSMPNIVTHEQVNEAAEQPKSRTSEEMTRAYIVSIRKALKKNKISYTVPPAKRGGGYCLKAVYHSANSKRRKAK